MKIEFRDYITETATIAARTTPFGRVHATVILSGMTGWEGDRVVLL